MAAPEKVAGEFENWLNQRLDALEIDKDVYGTYILGVLQEEEADEEKRDALQGILSAFLEDDHLEDVCKQIIGQWTEHCSKSATPKKAEEVQAIASLIEKQAQMVVKQKEVTDQERERKQALLAQYANVTDEEDTDGEDELNSQMSAAVVPSENSLFKNTNVEDVLSRQRQKRDQAKEDSQKKKEQDKMQREKDKLAKQERRDKEKKRTQKGERKR